MNCLRAFRASHDRLLGGTRARAPIWNDYYAWDRTDEMFLELWTPEWQQADREEIPDEIERTKDLSSWFQVAVRRWKSAAHDFSNYEIEVMINKSRLMPEEPL